jgi:hypothetical protein
MYKSYSYYWFVPFNRLFTILGHVTHDICLQETEVLNFLCGIQQLELKLTDTENNGLTEKCGDTTLKHSHYEGCTYSNFLTVHGVVSTNTHYLIYIILLKI